MINTTTNNSLSKTISSLTAKNINTILVEKGTDALEKIKEIIPSGATVMNGSSVTLQQIGFVDYLKSKNHKWVNLHEKILNTSDATKQASLRLEALHSDYYLGSVHALIENGDFVIASNTGSQLPHIVFTSPNLIFVVSIKKIVSDLNSAWERIEKVVIPLEDKRMMSIYNVGTTLNKLVIFKGENPMMKRKIHMILVKEDLGY